MPRYGGPTSIAASNVPVTHLSLPTRNLLNLNVPRLNLQESIGVRDGQAIKAENRRIPWTKQRSRISMRAIAPVGADP